MSVASLATVHWWYVALDQIREGLRDLITNVYYAVFFLFHGKQIQPVVALVYSFQLTSSEPNTVSTEDEFNDHIRVKICCFYLVRLG